MKHLSTNHGSLQSQSYIVDQNAVREQINTLWCYQDSFLITDKIAERKLIFFTLMLSIALRSNDTHRKGRKDMFFTGVNKNFVGSPVGVGLTMSTISPMVPSFFPVKRASK